MEYSFLDFLMLLGSLGVFLYGMKTMSEGLQKIAGNGLRSILATMTKNRVAGMFTGLLITALIQSSTATTVMTVSFANAGLLTLFQSIGVIMGANIGTTLTAWMISFFGFKFSISAFAIPLMAVALPFIFSSKSRRKSIGEFIMGFALLFMGLELLKNSVPDLRTNPDILAFLSNYIDLGFGSVLIFFGVGTLLTVILQSSTATMTITMIMCAKGWIPFELAAAMVLGENLGTTMTANIAAIPANVAAKRAALSHLIFNIIGVIWLLCVFSPFVNMIANIISSTGLTDPRTLYAFVENNNETLAVIAENETGFTAEQKAVGSQFARLQLATSYGLSLFHTTYNIINVFAMIWFVKVLERIVKFILPLKETDEEFQLKHISTGKLSISELSILQAQKEICVYCERTERMFGFVKELYDEAKEEEFIKTFSRVEKYEGISDRMEVEIAKYLTQVGKGRLSEEGKFQLQTMLRVISEIESVADGCYNLARTILRKRNDKSVYSAKMNENIYLMLKLVDNAFEHLKKLLNSTLPISNEDYIQARYLEDEINNFRNDLKLQNIDNVKEQKYDYQASVTYMDMIAECEKMGDYIINIAQALKETKYD